MRTVVTNALLVRQVAYGESDLIATLFTEAEGKLGALIRGGRKSTKRVGGAIEPFHTIEVRLDDRGSDLATLREARILRMRTGITANLDATLAAGTALRWVRHSCPPKIREPEAWATLNELLDAIDRLAPDASPKVALARGGLRLLADMGYALDLERCVKCGKECPPGRAARVDPARGGLVCASCGGARVHIGIRLRSIGIAVQRGGEDVTADDGMTEEDADALLALVDAAMASHAGFDR